MSPRLGARLVAVLLPAVAVLPAAAHAEKVVTDDPAGDASQVSVVSTQGSDELALAPAPDETSSDIIRTVVAHGTTRLSVTVHVRDLVSGAAVDGYLRVATPHGGFHISVEKVPGARVHADLRRDNQGDVECRALRASVDGAADTLSVSVPTTCLGAPRWVRIGVGLVRYEEPADGADPAAYVMFADDGHRDGDIREDDVAKGPRVHRG
jgi:hypothetical protein